MLLDLQMNNPAYGSPAKGQKGKISAACLLWRKGRHKIKNRNADKSQIKSKDTPRKIRTCWDANNANMAFRKTETVYQTAGNLRLPNYAYHSPMGTHIQITSPKTEPRNLSQIIQRTNQVFLLRRCNSINLVEDFSQSFRKNYLESFDLAGT